MTHLIYPTTNFKAIEQISIERGDGCYVWDTEGNQYLEGLSGLWCTALGYANQELIDVTAEQMKKLTFSHMFGGKTHKVAIELSEEEYDRYIADITNFLTYVSDPSAETRKQLGIYVILFLLIFTAFAYLVYREFKKDLK